MSATTENPLISVVVPAYQEEAGIAGTVEEIDKVLQGCPARYELIVVDDGSRDGTFAVISELCGRHRELKGIRLARNFGKESALLAGLRAAKGDAVITLDADLQHPPALIPELLEKWRGGARVVHAVKRGRVADGPLVRARAALFNRLLSLLGGLELADASDFKLLDRSAVDVLVHQMPERRRFYRGLVDWVGFEQARVPFDVAPREGSQGKLSVRALVDLAVTAMVSFTSAPLRVVTVLGCVTLVFGFFVSSEALWSWIQDRAVSGFVTIIITLLLLGSFIMISLGIVGEYIAKIYEEIKARPPYLVEQSCGFDAEETPD